MNDEKIYCVDTKVETFIREWYYADSDEDAIKKAKEGDYEAIDSETLPEFSFYPKDETGEYYIEVYDPNYESIYNNLW
jgi:uncharacterized Zn finger protein